MWSVDSAVVLEVDHDAHQVFTQTLNVMLTFLFVSLCVVSGLGGCFGGGS